MPVAVREYVICKNLLVRERKGERRKFLLVTDSRKQLDLKALKDTLGCSKLEFVQEEEMKRLIHTTPGNVSLFNMMYDKDKQVNYLETEDAKNRYNAQMKTSFPYCYGSYSSSFDITADTIKKVRQSSLKAYKTYIEFQQKQQDNSKYTAAFEEIKNEGYKLLDYSNKGISVGTLSCKKNS